MKLFRYLAVLGVVFSAGQVSGTVSMDPLWIYKDLPDTERIYGVFAIFDTSRELSINQIYPTPAGTYDSSFIDFNYQFSNDTMRVVDPFDSTFIKYKDYRPGYAGYKIDWDGGVTGFPLGKYKYLTIAHKGPLSNHKVTIRFGFNSGCGTPTTFETIGTFASSAGWKIDDIAIPESIRSLPASEIDNRSYYEMQVLVTNADGSAASSGPGVLQVDNIGLSNSPLGTTVAEESDSKKCGCGAGTGTALIPPLFFKAWAHRRRKKLAKKV